MRHLIPFGLRFRVSGKRNAPPPTRPLTAADLRRVRGMVDELGTQWALEDGYLRSQYLALLAAVIGPLIGLLFFDWTIRHLVLFLPADLLFMYLGDLLCYRLATKQVLAQGVDLQRSNYAGRVLDALFSRHGPREILDEPDLPYHELRLLYLECAAVLLVLSVVLVPGVLGPGYSLSAMALPLGISLVMHLAQAIRDASVARNSNLPTACAIPKTAATLYLFLAVIALFVPASLLLHKLTELPGAWPNLIAYAASMTICLILLAHFWKSLVTRRQRLLGQFLAEPREHWETRIKVRGD